MAIQGKGIKATTKSGEAVNLAGNEGNFGNNHAFSLIPSNYYTAVVRKVTEANSRRMVKGFESPDEDGKWKYLSITPDFLLLNDYGTIISRQSFTVGAVDEDGNLHSPNPDSDVVWGGLRGAREFLTAIKCFVAGEDGGFDLTFHAPAIRGLVVRVMTSIGGYRKGVSGDILPNEMKAMLNEFSDVPIEFDAENFDITAISNALNALNAAKGYDDETGYRLKNVIVKIVSLWTNKAEEDGLFVQTREVDGEPVATGRIFEHEAAAEAYEEAMLHSDLGDDF